jgi:hypothetical protein
MLVLIYGRMLFVLSPLTRSHREPARKCNGDDGGSCIVLLVKRVEIKSRISNSNFFQIVAL